MSNEQFSDCGTAYLSYEAHNKSMSYSTKTKLILLVAIMSIGPLSALRRRSVSSAMSYRPLDLTVERPGIQYFFLVLQFSTGACQFGSSFRQVIVDVDGRSAMLPVVSLSGRLVRGTPRHALCLMRTGRCTDAVGRLHAELRGGGFWRCPSVVGVVPASSRR